MSAPVTNILELGIRYRATFFDAMNRCDSEDCGEWMDILVVRVIYLGKSSQEQFSPVGLIKRKFLSNCTGSTLWMIQKQLSKSGKYHGNKFSFFSFEFC